MGRVTFGRLMEDAERRGYAVGYFESWNMESLLAVADAAEAARSPVILGFSGIALPHPARTVKEHLADYYALGAAVCDRLPVPACLLFNESARFEWVAEAVRLGFGLVMFTDEELAYADQVAQVRRVSDIAHAAGAASEGEMDSLPGVAGTLHVPPPDSPLTDPEKAREFVHATEVDSLAISVGQVHLHGRSPVRLDLSRVTALKAAVTAPLVLHGATSVARADLAQAVHRGVRKINVGSILKQTFFEAMRAAGARAGDAYNPYEVIGSGVPQDVMAAGRAAMQKVVQEYMELFGSAQKAVGF
ncbi:MAG: class II fructose-bisphosphate aldolase [Spirochaetia bacterium]